MSNFDPISYDKAEKAIKHSKNVQEQLNQAIADGDQLAETQQARVDDTGVIHPTLNERITSDVTKLKNKVALKADKTYVDTQLSDIGVGQINKNKGLIDQTFLTDELKQQIAGTAPINAIPADGSLTSVKYADKSVTSEKMADDFGSRYPYLDSTKDMNTALTNGKWLCISAQNSPDSSYSVYMLETKVFYSARGGSSWVRQIATTYDTAKENKTFERMYYHTNGFTPWKPISNETSDNFMVRFPYIADFNTALSNGKWVVLNAVNSPDSSVTSYMLEVKLFRTAPTSRKWGIQIATALDGKAHTWVRSFYDGTFRKWISITKNEKTLTGIHIVNFGDSIFGATRDATSISANLATKTGATVYNAGFGGCLMTDISPYQWRPYSMTKLADAIATNNWTDQETHLTGKDAYFATTVQMLKTMDWSKVYIITIAYGTNDFTDGATIEGTTTDTYKGAIRYSIERLLGAYPHLKIMLITPTYRFYLDDSNNFIDDSNTHLNGKGNKLTEFVQAVKDVGKEYNLPVLDNYYESGFNKFNRRRYFPVNDGTHPNAEGRALIASALAGELVRKFYL